MKKYTNTTASIQGTFHAKQNLNLQDGVCTRTALRRDAGGALKHLTVAVVTDGCGSGGHSEVGASMLALRLVNDLFALVSKKFHNLLRRDDYAECRFAGELSDFIIERTKLFVADTMRCVGFDLGINCHRGDQLSFLSHYLLSTVLFAVTVDDQAWLGSCGDGILYAEVPGAPPVIDLHIVDQDNMPHYPAYHWVPSSWLTKGQRSVITIPEVHYYVGANRLLLATDGAARFFQEGRVEELFSFEGEKGLQRRLNCGHPYSAPGGRQRPKWAVDDDATILLMELIQIGSEEEGDNVSVE